MWMSLSDIWTNLYEWLINYQKTHLKSYFTRECFWETHQMTNISKKKILASQFIIAMSLVLTRPISSLKAALGQAYSSGLVEQHFC